MRLTGSITCALLLTACGGGGDGGTPPGPTPASVSIAITPSSDPMGSIGDTRTLTATVRDASQAVIPGAAVTWSTDNAAVATLSGTSGLTTTATAAGNGTTTIHAQSGSASQTQSITVTQVLSSVAVSPATAFQVAVSGNQQLVATAKDARNATISGVTGFTYSSDNEAAATVSTTGLVHGVATGDANITVSLTRDGTTKSASVQAQVRSIPNSASVAATPALLFDPDQAHITDGGTISWVFGTTAHNVIFDGGIGAPANITGNNSSTTISRTFGTPGTFPYHCGIHPSMTGTIIVH
jgi:plastocyanin